MCSMWEVARRRPLHFAIDMSEHAPSPALAGEATELSPKDAVIDDTLTRSSPDCNAPVEPAPTALAPPHLTIRIPPPQKDHARLNDTLEILDNDSEVAASPFLSSLLPEFPPWEPLKPDVKPGKKHAQAASLTTNGVFLYQ